MLRNHTRTNASIDFVAWTNTRIREYILVKHSSEGKTCCSAVGLIYLFVGHVVGTLIFGQQLSGESCALCKHFPL